MWCTCSLGHGHRKWCTCSVAHGHRKWCTCSVAHDHRKWCTCSLAHGHGKWFTCSLAHGHRKWCIGAHQEIQWCKSCVTLALVIVHRHALKAKPWIHSKPLNSRNKKLGERFLSNCLGWGTRATHPNIFSWFLIFWGTTYVFLALAHEKIGSFKEPYLSRSEPVMMP